MIRITVNGEPMEIQQGKTLKDFLDGLNIPGGRVACEVNRRIIKRADHGNVVLNEGDVVEVVQMIGGGSNRPGPGRISP